MKYWLIYITWFIKNFQEWNIGLLHSSILSIHNFFVWPDIDSYYFIFEFGWMKIKFPRKNQIIYGTLFKCVTYIKSLSLLFYKKAVFRKNLIYFLSLTFNETTSRVSTGKKWKNGIFKWSRSAFGHITKNSKHTSK